MGTNGGLGYMSASMDTTGEPLYVAVAPDYSWQSAGPGGVLSKLRITVWDDGSVNQAAGAHVEWEVIKWHLGGAIVNTGIKCQIFYDVPGPVRYADSGVLQFTTEPGSLIAVTCRTVIHKGPNHVFASVELNQP